MQRKALVIGINDYPRQPLEYCVNDAREVAAMLEMPEYDFVVDFLPNEEAKHEIIQERISRLFAEDVDTAVLYFSGHGLVDEFGLYLIPIDAGAAHHEPGINFETIRRHLLAASTRDAKVVIVLDCCHAGSATPRGIFDRPVRYVENEDFHKAANSIGKGKVVLAACQAHEYAYERSFLKHGVFTQILLDGLLGDAADQAGDVSVHALYDFVSRSFEEIIGQTPVFKGDVTGRIVLGRNLSPREERTASAEDIRRIEEQALQEMDSYRHFVRSQGYDAWAESSYEDACRMFASKFGWFERQVERYPSIVNQPSFRRQYSAAKRELAHLGELESGYKTRYGEVKDRLGSGTFGTVWRLGTEGDKDVAYKVYNANDLDIVQKRKRFEHGYHAMGRLNHPNIVQVHQYTECPVGFLMDFIEGVNARNFAFFGYDTPAILRQLLTIGQTLRHAHGRGVIHRDVKPENIILNNASGTDDWKPFLTDFDLAWFSTATQLTNEGIGSYRYAAPEQLEANNSRAAHAPTADVYSFGQLCYYFLCLRDPGFNPEENAAILRQRVQSWGLEQPVSEIMDLYQRCTKTRPSERIQDFSEICDKLFSVIQLLENTDHSSYIGFARFVREVAFAIAPQGLAATSQSSFNTASGLTHIEISISEQSAARSTVTIEFHALIPPITNSTSFGNMREAINRRIDTSIRDIYSGMTRHPGTRSPFQTFIEMRDLPITIDGVEISRSVVARVVDCIEGKGL